MVRQAGSRKIDRLELIALIMLAGLLLLLFYFAITFKYFD